MANLNVDITGDCSGLLNALNNAQSAIDSLHGTTADVGVQVHGAQAAVSQLGDVSQAASSIGAPIPLAIDSDSLANTRSDVRGVTADVRGMSAELRGASSAMSELGGVRNDGSLSRFVDDLNSASSAMRGVGASSEDLGRAESSASSFADSFGAAGADVQSAARGITAATGDIADATEASGGRIAAAWGKASDAIGGVLSRGAQEADAFYSPVINAASAADQLAGSVGTLAAPVREATSALGAGASGATSFEGGLTSLSGAARTASQNVQGLQAQFSSFNQLYGQQPFNTTAPGTGGPTPPRGPTGGGGGGGGGGGAAGDGEDASKDFFGGVEGLGGQAMMGGMVGLGATAITAAAGLGSVYEAVQHIPSAFNAATQAEVQFNRGLNDTVNQAFNAAGGIDAERGAFQGLGTALGGLGKEVGAVGVANMGTAVQGITSLANTATTALGNMAPAIGPAIQGMVSLGDAVLSGISSPGAVAGIAEVGNVLSDPGNADGIANLTSGAVQLGTTVTDALVDVAGGIGQLTGMGGAQAVAPTLAGIIGGVAAGAKGGAAAAGMAGVAAFLGTTLTDSEVQQGQDPTSTLAGGLGSYALAGALIPKTGAALSPMRGAIQAGAGVLGATLPWAAQQLMPGQTGQEVAGAIGDIATGAEVGGMIGSAIPGVGTGVGALAGGGVAAVADLGTDLGWWGQQQQTSPSGITADSSGAITAPGGAASVPYGVTENADGTYSATPAPSGLQMGLSTTQGGGYALGSTTPAQQQAYAAANTPLTPQQALGGAAAQPGPSLLNALQAQQQAAAPAAQAAVPLASDSGSNLLGPGPGMSANVMQPAQMAQLEAATTSMSGSVGTLGVNSQAASQSLSALGQNSTQAAASATQVQQSTSNAMSSISQVAPTATDQLSQASTAIQSGGQDMGSQVTSSMASGISTTTGAACNAAAALGSSAADCGASALQAASPSKVFQGLGEGIGQGLAIGVTGSAPGATGAVREAMSDVVSAGQSGLAAHSPSELFITMGEGAMQGLQMGVTNSAPSAIDATTSAIGSMVDAANSTLAAGGYGPGGGALSALASGSGLAGSSAGGGIGGIGSAGPSSGGDASVPSPAPIAGGGGITSTAGVTPAGGGAPAGMPGGAGPSPISKAQAAAMNSPAYQQAMQDALSGNLTPQDQATLAAANANMMNRGWSQNTQDTLGGQIGQHNALADADRAMIGIGQQANNPNTIQGAAAVYAATGQYPTTPAGVMASMGLPLTQANMAQAGVWASEEAGGLSPVEQQYAAGTTGMAGLNASVQGMAGATMPPSLQPGFNSAANTPFTPSYGASSTDPNSTVGQLAAATGINASGIQPAGGSGTGTGLQGSTGPTGSGVGGGQTANDVQAATASSIMSAAGAGAGDASSGMQGQGAAMGQGFAQGMTSSLGAVGDAGAALATGASDASADAAGISSPSTVMMGHGGMMCAGFERGMQDGRGGPIDAMRRMVHDSMDAGRDEWDRGWGWGWGNGPFGPDGPMGGGSGGGGCGGGGGSGGGGGGGGWGWGRNGPMGPDSEHHDRWWDRADRWMDRLDHDRMGRDRDDRGDRDHGHDRGGFGDHGWGDRGGFGGFPWGWGGSMTSGGGGTAMGGTSTAGPMGWDARGGGRGWDDHGWGHDGGWGDRWGRDRDRGWDRHDHDHDRDRDRQRDERERREREERDRRERGDRDHRSNPATDQISDQVQQLANQTTPVLHTQGQVMGQAITQGMAVGITQGSSQVTQATSAAAQAAISQARSTLGISSPSRAFHEVGLMSAMGFVTGWREGGLEMAGDAAQSLGTIASQQYAQGIRTGMVDTGYEVARNAWGHYREMTAMMPFAQWELDEQLVGGFGSGVQAASDGTRAIASNAGLMVGDVWARSVVTGADNVLQTSLFSAITSPSLGSAYAQTALGKLGLLPAAGSGAEIYNTQQGNAGLVSMTPSVTIGAVNVSVGGQQFRGTIESVVDTKFTHLVNSVGAQRG